VDTSCNKSNELDWCVWKNYCGESEQFTYECVTIFFLIICTVNKFATYETILLLFLF